MGQDYGDVSAEHIKLRATRVWLEPALGEDLFGDARPAFTLSDFDAPEGEALETALDRKRYRFLYEYFTENGMSYHGTARTGETALFVSADPEMGAAICRAEWKTAFGKSSQTGMEIGFLAPDKPRDAVRMPFLFDAAEEADMWDAVQIAEQRLTAVYVLSLVKHELVLVHRRLVRSSDAFRRDLSARVVALLRAQVRDS